MRIYSDWFDIEIPGMMPNHVRTYGDYLDNILRRLATPGSFPFKFDGETIGVSTISDGSLYTEVTTKGYRLLYEALFLKPTGKLEVEF